MQTSPLLTQLMEALRCLPGVGPKSAQRMAFTLLQRDRSGGMRGAGSDPRHVRNWSLCGLPYLYRAGRMQHLHEPASSGKRSDLRGGESGGHLRHRTNRAVFRPLFCADGASLPLDGIGPDDIGLDRLEQRTESETIKEVILATNPTVEGEATANYIAELCAQYGVDASRIAHGVPVGGELEMVDGTTLSHSLAGRHKIIF